MSSKRTNTYPIADRWAYLWLAIGTVLSRLARGQQKLKAILSPYWEDISE